MYHEKIEFNSGLFVSNSGVVAKTFFHHVEPSKKISVHLNPVVGCSTVVERSEEVWNGKSLLGKFKVFIRSKLRRPMDSVSYQGEASRQAKKLCSEDHEENGGIPNARGKDLSNMFLNWKWSFLPVALVLYATGCLATSSN